MKVKSQLIDAQLEQRSTAPTKKSEVVFNTTDSAVQYHDGTEAQTLATIGATQELINKTVSTSDNDITATASTAAQFGDDGSLESSTVTTTELGYVSGVTSAIQTQLEAKADTTDLNDHINDTTDAHAASAITNTASGNLEATDVQSALNELQTDIDTRATSSDLTTHEADTSTHGVTGDIVGTSDEQTLSNKEFSDPILFDQVTTPANPASGKNKLYPKDDNKFYILDSDGNEVPVGSGSGGGVKNYFTDPNFNLNTTAAKVYSDYESRLVVSSSVDTDADEIGPVATTFSVGDAVKYTTSGTAIGGLTADETYYISSIGSSFKLAETLGGDSIDLTSQGSGTHTFTRSYAGTLGTADASHLAVSVNKTDPQSGLGSLEIDYTYAASTSALGEGVRIGTNKIDVQDQGKAQYVYLWFDFSDANYTAGDMKFKLWDKTNSKEIDLESLGIDTKIYQDARGYNFVFVPPTSTREYYFSLHSVDDNATASWKGKCGTFVMTPQWGVPADIKSVFSATFAADGTLSNATADFVDGDATITDTSLFAISFKSGFFKNTPNVVVSMSKNVSGQTQSAVTDSVSTTGLSVRTLSGGIKSAQPFTIFVQDVDRAKTSVTLGTNELAMTPLKLFRYESAATAFTSSTTIFKFSSGVIDNGSGWDSDNGQYKVPKAARLNIEAQIPFRTSSSTQGNAFCVLYVNGSSKLATYSTTKDSGMISLKYCDDFKAGDLIDIRVYNTTGTVSAVGTAVGCQATLSIDELPSFSKFSVYDHLVAGDVYNTTFSVTTSSLASNIPLTAETDTDGIVGTDSITIDEPGLYEFIPYFEMNSGTSTFTLIGQIWVNGANKRSINQAANNTHSGARGYLAKFNHGDIVTFHAKTDGGGPYTLAFSATFKKLTGG